MLRILLLSERLEYNESQRKKKSQKSEHSFWKVSIITTTAARQFKHMT